MLSSIVIALAVASVAMHFYFSYCLQAIADKNELSEFARFCAWIPLLSVYPWLVSAGTTLSRFLLGMLALVVASVAAIGASAALGGGVAAGALAFVAGAGCLAILAWFALLCWRLSKRRQLSGWWGLLLWMPLLNLLAIGRIALHDGFVRINPAGCALGMLLAIAGTISNLHTQQDALQEFSEVLTAAGLSEGAVQSGDPLEWVQQLQALQPAKSNPGQADSPFASGAHLGLPIFGGDAATDADPRGDPETVAAVRAMMKMADLFGALERMDPRDPAQRARAQALLVQTRTELRAQRGALGDPTSEEFTRRLDQIASSLAREMKQRRSPPTHAASEATPASISPAPKREATIVANSTKACPPGARLRGRRPPEGFEAWCERAGVEHGWHARWHANGRLESWGALREGRKVGTWTRWYPSGIKRVEAQFESGLQEGPMTIWNEQGRVLRQLRFRAGMEQ